ncbi:MAG: rRNA pseudouridine synthase [Acholeplasmataceae bacterium]|nr:rRNA pseudouridine synthase [Acholeplasmataceae bacterium]
MRIDKFLSNLKYSSRSGVKTFLKEHEVMIGDLRIYQPHIEVNPIIESVFIDGVLVFYRYPIYLMINKPAGYLSANSDKKYPCVIDLLDEPYCRFDFAIAGRLDLDSEGLMILTTEGSLAHEITMPKSHIPKTYEVILDRIFNQHDRLLEGVQIKDGRNRSYLAKALSVVSDDAICTITIDEGKFHQVKRMFEAVGYLVVKLKRIQIGQLKIGNLKQGTYKEFEKEELYDGNYNASL